jgi:Zn-dependent peptidase ImmA (M78 family)
MPPRPRYSHIERLVTSLLGRSAITRPPVPIEEIIRKHGEIAVKYSDLDEVSGLVVRQAGNIVIGVNRAHSATRRRFTLAHEFGHVLLHEGKEVRFDKEFRYNLRSDISTTGLDAEEVEANFFAASLLMPRAFMDADPRTHSVEVEDTAGLRELARSYGVSPQAMALRLTHVARRSTPSQTSLPF